MRNLSGHLIAWAICIAVALLGAEIYGAVLFYGQHGKMVYFNRPEATAPTETKAVQARKERLHPYLGFGGQYSLDTPIGTNNLGFAQRQSHKVPFQPKPNDVVVAVFGGSVANRMVVPPQRGLSLESALRELDQFSGKNVIVYNMAQGAAKQPQQVMALAMLRALGQPVDIVLNVDGFNEFAIGYENIVQQTHPVMPSMSILWQIGSQLAPASDKTADFYRIIYELLHSRAAIIQRTDAANRSRSGLEYLYNTMLISFYSRQRAAAEAAQVGAIGDADKMAGMRALLSLDMPIEPKADQWEELFRIWLHSSEALKDLSRGIGARYLHIIQPNQYFSNRQFSADEARIALSMPKGAPFRVGVEHGYALLEQRAGLVAARGIVSAIDLFDRQAEQIYVDNCCHYTRDGETILARHVAAQIAALPEKQTGR